MPIGNSQNKTSETPLSVSFMYFRNNPNMKMMEGGRNIDMAGASGTAGDSRWNPTKEQISMLESFYQQGIRTPSADQIQQITSRLKAYGSIEGKNVFYWFQNHKARLRQKQKSQNMAYINRHLYPPPGPDVVFGPYYLPQGDLGFYPQAQCPKFLLPGEVKRRGRPTFYGGAAYDYDLVHQDYNKMVPDIENYEGVLNNGNDNETLALFPLQPTGVLERRETLMSPFGSCSTSAGISAITTPSSSCEMIAGIDQDGSGGGEKHFFDFFSCPGSFESD